MRDALIGLVLLGATAGGSATLAKAKACTGTTQMELNACADQDFKTADAALNASYKKIMGRLKDEADTRKRLVVAQEAWLKFRDLECAFASSGVEGGSAQPMVTSACLEGITQARDKALQAYLSCDGGPLDCRSGQP